MKENKKETMSTFCDLDTLLFCIYTFIFDN